jgi:hypothetical protein
MSARTPGALTFMGRIADRGMEVLVPPDGTMREGKRPGWEHGLYRQMRDKLSTEPGNQLYRQRKRTVEQVYGQIKIQPTDRPVHARRQSRRAVRMAVSGSHPQPAEAPQPLDRRHGRVSGPNATTPALEATHPAEQPLKPNAHVSKPPAFTRQRSGRLRRHLSGMRIVFAQR